MPGAARPGLEPYGAQQMPPSHEALVSEFEAMGAGPHVMAALRATGPRSQVPPQQAQYSLGGFTAQPGVQLDPSTQDALNLSSGQGQWVMGDGQPVVFVGGPSSMTDAGVSAGVGWMGYDVAGVADAGGREGPVVLMPVPGEDVLEGYVPLVPVAPAVAGEGARRSEQLDDLPEVAALMQLREELALNGGL